MHIIGWWSIPALWAMATQFGQILPYADCTTEHAWSAVMCFTIVGTAVVVAAASWRRARDLAGTDRFLASSGCLIASILGFAVLLQGLATLVIDPCQR
jgi:hypothetical protein